MQADEKVKLARDGVPVTGEYAYLDTGSIGPISTIYAETLAHYTDDDLRMGRALTHRFDRIGEAKTRIRAEIASLLGGRPEEIELTQGTSDGVRKLLDRIDWDAGDEILTTQLEFPACADAINTLTRSKGVVVRIAEAPDGNVRDIEWLERCLTPRTRLIALSGVAFTTGQQLPIDRISELAVARGIRTLVDGAQLVGAAPPNLSHTQIDFLAMPLQKWLCGPDGLGALYVRTGALENGCSERLVQGWPVLEACAAHLAWLRETLAWSWIHQRTSRLAAHARHVLGGIDDIRLVTPEAHAGLVTIRCEAGGSERVAARLQSRQLIVRHRPELDSLRISTAFFNTENEIDRFADVVRTRDGQSNRKHASS